MDRFMMVKNLKDVIRLSRLEHLTFYRKQKARLAERLRRRWEAVKGRVLAEKSALTGV